MITKAIVDDVSDKYEIKVRIPLLDRASVDPRYVADAYLPSAPICTLPNTGLNLRKGDVVWVSFENGDPSRPVVVGCLYMDKVSETEASTVLNSLSVSANAKLPQNTTIGEVSSEELGYLKGLSSNVQAQIDEIKDTSPTSNSLHRHSIRCDIGSVTVFMTIISSKSDELLLSDFFDDDENPIPQTIDSIVNARGLVSDGVASYDGVGVSFSMDYSPRRQMYTLVMQTISSRGTITVSSTRVHISDFTNFSDTVEPL